MESLFATSQLLISRVDTTYVRDKHNEIDWNSRLVAILGARGTGKTTMILQHIRLHNTTSQALYVMADDFYFTSHRLEELANKFMLLGGKYLYIDEIHKYKGWSTEIKNIYADLFPGADEVRASLELRVRLLISDDFPTLDFPAMAISCMPCWGIVVLLFWI